MSLYSIVKNLSLAVILAITLLSLPGWAQQDYVIVDTGQEICYDDQEEILPPLIGSPFYGQDAQYDGVQPSYMDNGNGTITDLNTGLIWQKTPDLDNKSTFYGSSQDTIPYIDTTIFDFAWGNTAAGERLIDAQYWSSTEYVGFIMPGSDAGVFGVNFADGRIKCYPRDANPMGQTMEQYVRYVRGNTEYGVNNFVDNGDGTITDLASGLMWQKADDGNTRNWEESLDYAENLSLAGNDDWRLPNAKELHSILDYARAPDAVDPQMQSAAIDPIFEISEEEGWFWTGTTLLEAPQEFDCMEAVYIAFGRAMGYMYDPFMGDTVYTNVHGAGAQRGDPKAGDPAQWPQGFGPQGDEIRIYNYVRCVRGNSSVEVEESKLNDTHPENHVLLNVYPNPFNPEATISFTLPAAGNTSLVVFNTLGQQVATLADEWREAGTHQVVFKAHDLPNGIYFAELKINGSRKTSRTVLVK